MIGRKTFAFAVFAALAVSAYGGKGIFDVRMGGAVAVLSDSADACFGLAAPSKAK